MKVKIELCLLALLAVVVFFLSSRFDFLEKIVDYSRQHEELELDEILTVFIFLVFALGLFSARRWWDVVQARRVVEQQKLDLEKALTEIQQLQGILPICSHCKSIRDEKGSWQPLEAFVSEHSDAQFTHGLCPGCLSEHYPDYLP